MTVSGELSDEGAHHHVERAMERLEDAAAFESKTCEVLG